MGKRMESLGCKIWVWSNQGKRFCMELKSRIDNMTGCIPDRWVSLGSWNRACCCIVHYLPWQKVEVSHGKIVLLLWFSWHDVSEHFTVVREVFCTNSEKKKIMSGSQLDSFLHFLWLIFDLGSCGGVRLKEADFYESPFQQMGQKFNQ